MLKKRDSSLIVSFISRLVLPKSIQACLLQPMVSFHPNCRKFPPGKNETDNCQLHVLKLISIVKKNQLDDGKNVTAMNFNSNSSSI